MSQDTDSDKEDSAPQKGVVARNLQSVGHFLWNKDTNEIAGRTISSWVQISLFFIVLYTLLICFWLGLLNLAQLRLPQLEQGPLYTDYLSHRGPGLHLVPGASVIGRDRQKIFYMDNKDSYLRQTTAFFNNRNDSTNLEDPNLWGACSAKNFNASWEDNTPCFYFYLNAIHNFIPQPIDEDQPVTIKCYAAKSNYEKYIEEVVSYPSGGFDLDQFPWKYSMDWDRKAPLVAVRIHFTNKLKGSAEARVKCHVVAKNIFLDSEKPNIGMVDFRIHRK